MGKDIGVEIDGIRGVQLRFERFPEAARDRLRENFEGIISRLFGRIQSLTPTKTGSLRAHEKTAEKEGRNFVRANFFLTGDWGKAGALEFGAPGPQSPRGVSPHTMQLDHVFAHQLQAPMSVMVERFSRTQRQTTHRFIRGPAEEIHDETIAAIQDALQFAEQDTKNAN